MFLRGVIINRVVAVLVDVVIRKEGVSDNPISGP